MLRIIKNVYHQFQIEIGFVVEAYCFWRKLVRYNASNHTDRDKEKMRYTLLRENHTIEKGMSLRNPRKGFGQAKVSSLLKRLNKYTNLYWKPEDDFLSYPITTIYNYIEYTKQNGVSIPDIEQQFNVLVDKTKITPLKGNGGITKETREHIQSLCNKDFNSLLISRHSIRYFAPECPSRSIIEKALQMAQRTPSACNRQGWKTHVYFNERSVELIKWQGGSRGFEEEIRCSILVTANLKAFLSYEVHQAYVDGGLYAMNLINALHSLGVGCIPLSTAFSSSKLNGLKKFDIPDNEVPILIIGVGNLQNEFNVAISERKDINKTNTYH